MSQQFDSLENSALHKLLINGAVGVLLTDTVYGLVACATNAEAVARLYTLKNRHQKPGTLIAANIDQLVDLGIKRAYLKAVEQFWPGPVTIVVPTSNQDFAYLRQDSTSIAVRVSADENLNKLIIACGPLLTSSANTPGNVPAVTITEAQRYFGDQADFYVDGGAAVDRQLSAIVRMVDDALEVLRPGPGFAA